MPNSRSDPFYSRFDSWSPGPSQNRGRDSWLVERALKYFELLSSQVKPAIISQGDFEHTVYSPTVDDNCISPGYCAGIFIACAINRVISQAHLLSHRICHLRILTDGRIPRLGIAQSLFRDRNDAAAPRSSPMRG
jgi:hypothetical protein